VWGLGGVVKVYVCWEPFACEPLIDRTMAPIHPCINLGSSHGETGGVLPWRAPPPRSCLSGHVTHPPFQQGGGQTPSSLGLCAAVGAMEEVWR
jgi:hypothetical protein